MKHKTKSDVDMFIAKFAPRKPKSEQEIKAALLRHIAVANDPARFITKQEVDAGKTPQHKRRVALNGIRRLAQAHPAIAKKLLQETGEQHSHGEASK